MKYIIKNKKTGETIKYLEKFPSKDINKPIIGFDYKNNDIFIVIEELCPLYNENKSYLEKKIIYSEELHPDYYKVKICKHTEIIKDYSQKIVLEKLNTSLGEHLDSQYPLWERIKHSGEGIYTLWDKTEGEITQEQADRKTYIDSVYVWITSCRNERDIKENEFINNNAFPSFEWENRPTI